MCVKALFLAVLSCICTDQEPYSDYANPARALTKEQSTSFAIRACVEQWPIHLTYYLNNGADPNVSFWVAEGHDPTIKIHSHLLVLSAKDFQPTRVAKNKTVRTSLNSPEIPNSLACISALCNHCGTDYSVVDGNKNNSLHALLSVLKNDPAALIHEDSIRALTLLVNKKVLVDAVNIHNETPLLMARDGLKKALHSVQRQEKPLMIKKMEYVSLFEKRFVELTITPQQEYDQWKVIERLLQKGQTSAHSKPDDKNDLLIVSAD